MQGENVLVGALVIFPYPNCGETRLTGGDKPARDSLLQAQKPNESTLSFRILLINADGSVLFSQGARGRIFRPS